MREQQGSEMACMAAGCNRMKDSSRCEKMQKTKKCPLGVSTCIVKYVVARNNFRWAIFADRERDEKLK